MMAGLKRSISTPNGTIHTRSLMVADLRKVESVTLQEQGIGEHRLLGCGFDYVYQDGNLLVCPECAYEFSAEDLKEQEVVIKDANGNVLKDGDTVTVCYLARTRHWRTSPTRLWLIFTSKSHRKC
jgi:hypothetical protein